mmetsp:Transcript_27650/g.85416  ORF Transcript_27650/g.85416 Transcript_27650/m.85416 type:complete len:98 (-) Transcript_27650:10568-10861(-)
MLHTIYKTVIADLDREESRSGGEAPSPVLLNSLFRLEHVHALKQSTQVGSAHNACAFIMHQLLNQGLEKELNIDVQKLKHFPRSRLNRRKSKRLVDS